MAFVKLDCGILNSTIWIDRNAREIFITALLMAEPYEAREPMEQIATRSLDHTGFVVPPGWYGFVPAAGVGIVRMSHVDSEAGMAALERLAAEDPESRTGDFGGRRLVRVDGGYIILNYDKYRNKDHTTAERSRRYREKKFAKNNALRHAVTDDCHAVTTRGATQAEAEAYTEQTAPRVPVSRIPTFEAWLAYAMEQHPTWPHADIRRAWEHYESVGWKKGKSPIVKWKLCVSTCFRNYSPINGQARLPELPLREVK